MDKNGRQPSHEGDAVSGWSRRKFASFAAITVLLGLAVSLGAVELFLRYHDRQIAHSEHMEPGLIGYNAELGWQLTPGWSGTHHHYDYDVEYNIDANGFRVDPQAGKTGSRVAVLGDSFTFGLGVANDETFVSRLNAENETRQNYLNLSVPGYSTDQELLLFKKTANPSSLMLSCSWSTWRMTCLIINAPSPCRQTMPSPTSGLIPTGSWCWKTRRYRLPLNPLPPATPGWPRWCWVIRSQSPPCSTRTLGRLHIARHLGLFQQQGRVEESIFQARFDSYITLFLALVDSLHESQPGNGC